MKRILRFRKALTLTLVVSVFATMMTFVSASQQAFAAVDFNAAPVPTLSDTVRANAWTKIGKTMHLLETGQKVRIAITGQSISDSPWGTAPNDGGNTWTVDLIEWLREQYPDADIEYKNFAIGGFATNVLKKRIYNDMASFGPDLCIMYVYGSHIEYEEMVKSIRDNMETEMLLQTEHYTGAAPWSDTMSQTHIPNIARKYGCGVAEIRAAWKKWITDYQEGNAKVLLRDDVHLNADGQTFMLELMKQFFLVAETSDAAEMLDAQTVEVSADDWENGALEVSGIGTRAEVIAGDGTQYPVDVLVDGKKPSEYPDCYIRSAEANGMTGTIMGIINYNDVPYEQTWTITLDSFTSPEEFQYSVDGSVSGHQGQSTDAGVLDGSILNMTADSFIWNFNYNAETGAKPAVGSTYTFKSILNGTDVYDGKNGYSENSQLLFNFKSSGTNEHTVKLTAQNASQIPDIKAIRFYNPSLRVTTSTTPKKDPNAGETSSPEATETPVPSAVATQTPDTSATVEPTATSTITPSPVPTPAPKSIRFTKKKVTIKKGKKKVIKVKIKGAKKANFSVNKKGKKVVKLLKKKAKQVTVKGKKKGKAIITAKAVGKKARCTVKVK